MDFKKRAQGGLKAVASLTPEQVDRGGIADLYIFHNPLLQRLTPSPSFPSLPRLQIEQITTQERGHVTVAVVVTDEGGNSPIACEMVWAWTPKVRPARTAAAAPAGGP